MGGGGGDGAETEVTEATKATRIVDRLFCCSIFFRVSTGLKF